MDQKQSNTPWFLKKLLPALSSISSLDFPSHCSLLLSQIETGAGATFAEEWSRPTPLMLYSMAILWTLEALLSSAATLQLLGKDDCCPCTGSSSRPSLPLGNGAAVAELSWLISHALWGLWHTMYFSSLILKSRCKAILTVKKDARLP